jgi:excisionase family DNA binding protein
MECNMENERETAKSIRRVVTVEEAAAILRISRGAAYQAAKTKQLPTIRIGRRLLVPLAALERLLGSAAAA